MQKRRFRNLLRLFAALLCFWLYIPHLIVLLFGCKQYIYADIQLLKRSLGFKLNDMFAVLYFLHNNRYYRNLFYHRIGPIKALLISWIRPGDRYFILPDSTQIGKGLLFAHPYATVLNAESIGDYFSCLNCVTIGKKGTQRPVIGNHVSMGAGSMVIGPVHIGNNVTIGAGAVVVKDVPDNCVVAGNPARIIKRDGVRV
jgi:serine acetyltransferase